MEISQESLKHKQDSITEVNFSILTVILITNKIDEVNFNIKIRMLKQTGSNVVNLQPC